MASKDIIGSQAELKQGPADMTSKEFGGGTIDMIGSTSELHHDTPMGVFNKGTQSGTIDMIGSEAEFHRTPQRGWQSYPTPSSRNTETPDKG